MSNILIMTEDYIVYEDNEGWIYVLEGTVEEGGIITRLNFGELNERRRKGFMRVLWLGDGGTRRRTSL